jgi:5-methylcytosine-specific restriction endonuclease McrA
MHPISSGSYAALSDRDLLVTVKRLAERERQATAQLIALLSELDARRLYLGEGCSSLFTYCTQVLHLSEHAAYGRIEAARAARRFPVILELLANGSITLTTVTLLAPHLTSTNVCAVLEAARHKSKREVERQVASLRPRPDVPFSIRKQPTPPLAAPCAPLAIDGRLATPAPASPAPPPSSPRASSSTPPHRDTTLAADAPSPRTLAPPPHTPSRRSVVEPLAPERYKIQVTVAVETVEKLRRVQDLMRHTLPNGDPAAIIDHALTLLLAHLERTALAATDRPRASRPASARSRHIPAAVRRAVWARDEGQCTFVGPEGRCRERGFLEFHHIEPYARGGRATVQTIALRCRPHNQYEAEQEYGLRPSTYSRGAHPSSRPPRTVDPVDTSGEDAVDRDRSLPWIVREGRSIYGSRASHPVRTEFLNAARYDSVTGR